MNPYNGNPNQVAALKAHLGEVYPGADYDALSAEKIALAASNLLNLGPTMMPRAEEAAKRLPKEEALGMLYGLIMARDASVEMRDRVEGLKENATPDQLAWVEAHMPGRGLEDNLD